MHCKFWVGALFGLLAAVPVHAEGERAYGHFPLSFEINRGQTDKQVRFLSRGNGYGLFLTDSEAVLSLTGSKPSVLRMKLLGRDPETRIEGTDPLLGESHYLVGSDSQAWHDGVPTYGRVRYSGVYPGIDLFYYGNQRQLEFDFVVSPGSDPNKILLGFEGAQQVSIDHTGDLLLQTAAGEIRQKKPFVYQEVNGERQLVEGSYVRRGKNRVGFKLAAYDRKRPLIIDPILVYSTYLGGSDTASIGDVGIGIAVDGAGNAYVTGQTTSVDFPVAGSLRNTNGGKQDAFILKLNPSGTQILFSTYIGGSDNDEGHGIALDAAGNIFVTGYTSSPNFPLANAFQATRGGNQDAYVLKLNNSGTALIYSTFLGGALDDRAFGLAVDASGSAYVTGLTSSLNFPVLNAYQPVNGGGFADIFVTKLTPSGGLSYSTFVGGRGHDQGYGIAIDNGGNAYITGYTTSLNFPVPNAFQKVMGGGSDDAILVKLNPAGNALVFSTYLGGVGSDNGVRVVVDAAGSAYVTGYTASFDFPVVNPAEPLYLGGFDIFVTKFAPGGNTLEYSTFAGGSDSESGVAIAVDSTGSAYVTGFTTSVDIPSINSYQARLAGTQNAYIIKLSPDGGHVLFSTYLGGQNVDGALGIVLDSRSDIYVTGYATSTTFPVSESLQLDNAGGRDGFVLKLSLSDIRNRLTFGLLPQAFGSLTTQANNDDPRFGYAVTEAAAGVPVQSGLALMDLSTLGSLTTEIGVQPAQLIRDGRFYVNVTSTVRSVFSAANPSDEDAAFEFYITDDAGTSTYLGAATVPARSQFSRFVTDPPFNLQTDIRGALTASSSIPVAMAAFTTTINEQSGFILNTSPVADLAKVGNTPVVIPHFVAGFGWYTDIILINTSEDRMAGELRFFDPGDATRDGTPLEVTLNDTAAPLFGFDVPARSYQLFRMTTPSEEVILRGSANIVPYPGFNTPQVSAVIGFVQSGVNVSRTNTDALVPTSTYRLIAEASGDFDAAEALSKRTAVAIANPGSAPAAVRLELLDLFGTPAGFSGTVTIPANGQFASFLPQMPGFEALPAYFNGVLRITTSSPAGIAVVGFRMRYNQLGNLLTTTTGPIRENAGSAAGLIFPHIADGGGYTTQFILLGGTAGQSSNGNLLIRDQEGQPMDVTVR